MKNGAQQGYFLRNEFGNYLRQIKPDTAPLFGKMNPQQMAEHMAEYIRLGYGNPKINESAYSADVTEKMRSFLQSEKPFRPNTPNPLMPETPIAVKTNNYEEAIKDVEKAITELFLAFEQNQALSINNPFFGTLDFSLTLRLLTKHAQHHLRQFGAYE